MSPARPQPVPARRIHSALVWLLAALIFALGLLNAAPAAHERLHAGGHDHDSGHTAVHDDTGCAVTLFAQGVTAPLDLPRLPAPRLLCLATLAPAGDGLHLAATPHLTPPGRGPPRIG